MIRWWMAVLWLAAAAHAQIEVPDLDPPAEGILVAEHASVAPGGTLWVGLRITLKPTWHVYWTNPGDSGMPPGIKWSLPEGVTASAQHWPAPHRLPADPLMMYGYGDEVLLPIELKVPQDWKGEKLKVGVSATWLVCSDVCLEGGMAASTEIPVRVDTSRTSTDWGPLFVRTRDALPKPPPAGALSATSSGLEVDLKRMPIGENARVYFFPGKAGWLEHAAPQAMARTAARAVLALPLAVPEQKELKNRRVQGVLVIRDGGSRSVYAVDVPVTPPEK